MEPATSRNRSWTWEELWEKGYRSERFRSGFHPESFREDKALSERLLFTQSNARVLLGQDTAGRLAFVCAPHELDYGLPTCVVSEEYPISAHPGMYDQTDVAMWFGCARFRLELSDGRQADAIGESGVTWYHDHFLPVSKDSRDGLKIHVMSLAPVLENGAVSGIPGAQLSGPSGAIFALHLTNTSGRPVSGRCHLRFDPSFVIRSEFNDVDPFEVDAAQPYHREWERDLYTLWRPDACACIHLAHGQHNQDASDPELYREFELAPGACEIFECRIAVAPDKRGIAPALSVLFQHSALEWINITRAFWKERLGDWSCEIEGEAPLASAYRDMQIRNIIDNFNCLQTDADGRLLVHWQGAPSHNLGRFWGIDIEPTALSVLYAIPELGPSLLDYIAKRNEPRYSVYPDHSTPIRVALLVIAGQYYELTGDLDCFRRNPKLMEAIRRTLDRLLRSKHPSLDLFPSRYSSDGIVFHRYDLGTNAKVYFALNGAGRLMSALGEPMAGLDALLGGIRRDILGTMTAEGPFGPQFTGGNNLGEGEGFYFRDDLWYYDGEDSSSCMMPVYGIFGFEDEAWRNYHRFARSLFCTNYDPEMGALRWFFHGGAIDGTAYVSKLGGSVTREEMKAALNQMLGRSVDDTGSLYWWPKAVNKRRCIARCSQGQGSWVLQGTEQWLGLHYDAPRAELTVSPRGLLNGYRWMGARLGGGAFDIEWREADGQARLRVTNRNPHAVHVRAGVRSAGAGADGEIAWHRFALEPGECAEFDWAQPVTALAESVNPARKELEVFGEEGVAFGLFGLHLPSVEQRANACLLRFVLISWEKLDDVRLELQVPKGWGILPKAPRVWDALPERMDDAATLTTGTVAPYERQTLSFYLALPAGMDAAQVWLNEHPFEYPVQKAPEQCLYALSEENSCRQIEATLRYRDAKGEVRRTFSIPVRALTKPGFDRMVRRIVYENR